MRFDALDLAKRLDLETRLWHWDIKKCQAGLERQVLLVVKQKDCTSAEHQCRLINATFHPLWTAGTFYDTFMDALAFIAALI